MRWSSSTLNLNKERKLWMTTWEFSWQEAEENWSLVRSGIAPKLPAQNRMEQWFRIRKFRSAFRPSPFFQKFSVLMGHFISVRPSARLTSCDCWAKEGGGCLQTKWLSLHLRWFTFLVGASLRWKWRKHHFPLVNLRVSRKPGRTTWAMSDGIIIT